MAGTTEAAATGASPAAAAGPMLFTPATGQFLMVSTCRCGSGMAA